MNNILFFSDIRQSHFDLVGGKATNLGFLVSRGITVPNGFCITTDVYKKLIANSNIISLIEDMDSSKDFDKYSTLIRENIVKTANLNEFKEEISESLKKLNGDLFSVRSSATNEDLEDLSFAGQQDTYLNIKSKDLLPSIIKCFASTFTERACAYRNANNISHLTTYMAVIIQEMVQAKFSGIGFSVDPISQDRNSVSIDASYGLGEALVSGIVDCDTYIINNKASVITKKRLGKKDKKIALDEFGKTTEIALENSSHIQVINDQTIFEVTALIKSIENMYSSPIDVEFAILQNKIYILQARKVTTLFPKIEKAEDDDVFLSFNHIQVMTKQMSPLGIDIWKYLFFLGKGEKGKKSNLLTNADGFIFLNISELIYESALSKFFVSKIGLINRNFKDILSNYLEDDNTNPLKDWNARLRSASVMLPLFLKTLPHFVRSNENLASRIEGIIQGNRNEFKHTLDKSDSLDKLNVIKNTFHKELKNTFYTILPHIIASGASSILLRKLIAEDKKKFLKNITAGLKGNLTTEMGLELDEIISYFTSEHIPKLEEADTLNKLLKIPSFQYQKRKIREFFERFGHRGIGEIDIYSKRYVEDISLIKNIIINQLKNDQNNEASTKHLVISEKVKHEISNIVVSEPTIKRLLIEHLIYVYRNNFLVREHGKYSLVTLLWESKKAFLDIEKELLEKNLLENKDDIFFLEIDEIEDILTNSKDYKEVIISRKNSYDPNKDTSIPHVVKGSGEILKRKPQSGIDNSTVGEGISSGVVRGKIKIITDPTNAVIEKNDIIVVPFTDPGWTPLLINASAIIMEVGGLMTHGAIVAREYGIPGIASVEGATKLFKNGQIVEVDGDNGVITLV